MIYYNRADAVIAAAKFARDPTWTSTMYIVKLYEPIDGWIIVFDPRDDQYDNVEVVVLPGHWNVFYS